MEFHSKGLFGYNSYKKVTLVNFSQNISFWDKWVIWDQYGPKLGNLISRDWALKSF